MEHLENGGAKFCLYGLLNSLLLSLAHFSGSGQHRNNKYKS